MRNFKEIVGYFRFFGIIRFSAEAFFQCCEAEGQIGPRDLSSIFFLAHFCCLCGLSIQGMRQCCDGDWSLIDWVNPQDSPSRTRHAATLNRRGPTPNSKI